MAKGKKRMRGAEQRSNRLTGPAVRALPEDFTGWPAGYQPGGHADPERGGVLSDAEQADVAELAPDVAEQVLFTGSAGHTARNVGVTGLANARDAVVLPSERSTISDGQRAELLASGADPEAAHVYARWAAQIESDPTWGDDPVRVSTTLARGEQPGTQRLPVGPAPTLRTAADLPEVRRWLVSMWQARGLYRNIAANNWARATGVNPTELADAERIGLQRAQLYSVAPAMCDLLQSVAPSCPDDTRVLDLHPPAESGFVVFERPLVGLADAEDGENKIQVDAIMWQPLRLPDGQHGGDRLACLGISSYRRIDFAQGMDQHGMAVAVNTGAIALGTTGHEVGKRESDGAPTYNLTGEVWCPLGRSDWPIGDQLDTRPWWVRGEANWASFREDRQLVAALWTLLEQQGIASQAVERAPRPVQRRLARDPQGVVAPASVVVVTLRQPKAAPHPRDPDAPELAPRQRTHRWLVREHLRWQPVGPGRQERRLTMVRAHVRGPEDAPLVIKEKVNRWVR